MSVLHKTADPVDYRERADTAAYDTREWFVDPDVTAVSGIPKKYWQRPLTDPVQPMNQSEKDAVNAAEVALEKQRLKTDFDTDELLKALALVLLDEINLLRASVIPPQQPRTAAQLRDALRTKIDG